MYEIVYNSDFVPIPSSEVRVKTMVVDGKTSYLMKNSTTGTYYEPDESTNLIWTLTDGKRTVKQIVEEVQKRNPSTKEDDVTGVLLFFADSNLLVSNAPAPKKKRFKVVSSFEMDYTLIEESKKFLQSIHNKLQKIFRRCVAIVGQVQNCITNFR